MVSINPWITCFQPKPQADLQLFCFPYAGAGASVFRTWADQPSSSIEVYAIQLPGRETRLREPPLSDMPTLVKALAPILTGCIDRPFAFFGHSLGALVSFELARYLQCHQKVLPQYLFASGRWAPQLSGRNPCLHTLPDAEFVTALRQYDGTPEAVLQNPELMEIFLPILRADLKLNETYQYLGTPPLNCPIAAFGGLDDEDVSCDDLAAWREQTKSAFSLHLFPGNHLYLKNQRSALLSIILTLLHES